MAVGYQAVITYSAKDKATNVSNSVTRNISSNNNRIKSSYGSLAAAAARNMRQINSSLAAASAASFASSTALVAYFSKSVAQTGMSIDKFKNQMLVATGSLEMANSEWEKAKKLAEDTGASLSVVTETYGKFSVAAQSAGMSGTELTNVYQALLKGTVAMGLGQENVKLALKAVEQMMSKGTVMAEELKGQFGEQIPDAMGLMSRALGVSTGELIKLMEAGKVMAADAVPKLASQMEKEWGGAATNALGQLRTSMNKLDVAFVKLKESIINLGLYDKIQKGVDYLASTITHITDFISNDMVTSMKNLKLSIDMAFNSAIFASFESGLNSVFGTVKSMHAWAEENLDGYGILGWLLIGLMMRHPIVAFAAKIIDKVKGFVGVIKQWARTLKMIFDMVVDSISNFDKVIMKAIGSLSVLLGLEAKRRGDENNPNFPTSVKPSFGDTGLNLAREAQTIQQPIELTKATSPLVDLQAEVNERKKQWEEMLKNQWDADKIAADDSIELARKVYQEKIKLEEDMFKMKRLWANKDYQEQKKLEEETLAMQQAWRLKDSEDAANTSKQMSMMQRLWAAEDFKEKQRLAEENKNIQTKAAAWMASEAGKGTMAVAGATSQALGMMADMQDKSTKKGFENWKAMATAQALINTFMGVTNALATVPFPFNMAVATMVGAMGAMQVAKIQSEQFQPRMGGGNVFAGQTYTVGERGKELFVPDTNGRIYPNSALEQKATKGQPQVIENKPVNITFAVTSADAKDFDRMLAQRQDTIVNLVRRGMA